MSEATAAPALPDVRDPAPGHHHQGGLLKLAIGAVGIVFGDIGTSPLYAFRQTLPASIRCPSTGSTSWAC